MATETSVTTAPAVETPAAETPATPIALDKLSPVQYDNWRKTGELPAEKPAAAKTPKSENQPADGGEPREPATAAAPGKKGVSSMSHRELRELARQQEAEIERLRKGGSAQPKTEPAAAAPPPPPAERKEKPEPRPRPDDKNADGTPKYKEWNDYEDARDAWLKAEAKREIREDLAKEQREQTVQQQNRRIEQSWKERVDKASEKHADFAEVALDREKGPGKRIGRGSVVDGFILDSELGAEILYHFGKHPEDLERYATLNPYQAARELTKLETKLAGEPVQTSAHTPKETPPKEPKRTPPPATDIGGRGTSAVDDVEKAVRDNPSVSEEAFRRFKDAANRRDIKERLGTR
jgi:hypothetical protein